MGSGRSKSAHEFMNLLDDKSLAKDDEDYWVLEGRQKSWLYG